jgi:hypothetical protein
MFETLIERLLRSAGIEMPVRQYEVWDGDEFIARIDFAKPGSPLGQRGGRGPPWGKEEAGVPPGAKRWLTVTPHVGLEPRGYWCHSGRAKFQSDTDRANSLGRTRWRIV